MKKQKLLTGMLLILAAFTFLLSWWLMPDPGTTDTSHILQIVKQSRTAVVASVIIQILSSILYILAMLMIVKIISPERTTMAGITLLAIGAMGLCSDAFFHLLAWFMTDNSVTIQKDVIQVMTFMQTDALLFLVPILLPLLFGSLVLAMGLNKQKIISNKSKIVFTTAFVIGILSAAAGKFHLYNGPSPVFGILALFAGGQILMGIEFAKTTRELPLQYKSNKIIIQVNH